MDGSPCLVLRLFYIGAFLNILTGNSCNAVVVTAVWPIHGSLNGETRLTIDGGTFSSDQYNAGNTVKLVSDTRVYDCNVHKDGTHEHQIMCYTPKGMVAGTYNVRVAVDGVEVPVNCRGRCTFRAAWDLTPTITAIDPVTQSSLPGGFLTIHGRIFSGISGSNTPTENVLNGIYAKILRVYAAAQLCEIRGENDTFHGLVLHNNGYSHNGYMKCLMKGTYVGNTNVSYIIGGSFGRSLPNSNLLRVASNDEIYTIQTYAKVTGVSPSTGSIEGGTILTITGQYFDETKSAIKVMVGGTACEVTKLDTNTSTIECRTAPKLSAPRYNGNRGLSVDSAAYNFSRFIDHIHFTQNDGVDTRLHGYFVPPHDGLYTLHLKADSVATLFFSMNENPADKTMVAHCPAYTTSYFSWGQQTSSLLTLQKDKTYFIEVIHKGRQFVRVAAQHKDTKFSSSMTGLAKQEKQKIVVTSKVEREVQRIKIENMVPGNSTNEIQEVKIVENSGFVSDATYQLGLYGTYTRPLLTVSEAADIMDALNDLPFLDASESFNVTVDMLEDGDTGTILRIEFKSDRGDFPDLDYKTTRGSDGQQLEVTVQEITQGVPTGNYISMLMEGKSSPLIPAYPTAYQLRTALEAMFGTRCPSFLTEPADSTVFQNYESGYMPGWKTNEIEPFCGRYVVKDPGFLYSGASLKLSSKVTTLCFAYIGGQLQDTIELQYTYEDENETLHDDITYVGTSFDHSTGWHYHCVDMLEKLKEIRPSISYFMIRVIKVFRRGGARAFYIDDVYIGRQSPLEDVDQINLYRMRPARPNNNLIKSVYVTYIANGTLDIVMEPFNCGHNFTMFYTGPGQIVSGGKISFERIIAASPPITGSFGISFRGINKPGFAFDFENTELREMLETIDGIGSLSVYRNGICSNFDIVVNFDTLPGDQPKFETDYSTLFGREVRVYVVTLQDGGLWHDPIRGDMLRTDHANPQVEVHVNSIPSICSGDCSFTWSEDSTPSVTGVSPTSGAPGTPITISGSNFGDTAADNEISIGGVSCSPTSGDQTNIICTTGQGSHGTHIIDLYVNGKGKATNDGSVQFQYLMGIQGISPSSGSIGGRIPLTITGYGFSYEASATVGGKACGIISSNFTEIVCLLPSSAAGDKDVTVTVNGHVKTSSTKYTYITPSTVISSVSPTIVNVVGGSILTVTGSGFGTSGTLKIETTEVSLETYTDTEITATLPSLPPGAYTLLLFVDDSGATVDLSGNVPTVEYQLSITNVFPRKSSLYGGVRLTLTGQGFSSNKSMVEVKVGNYGCNIETVTTTQIVCLLDETSDVIKIDNQGVHPTWGRGYQWNPVVAHAKVGDIIEWTWTSPSWIKSFTHRVEQTKNETSFERAPDGFMSGTAGTFNGQFRHKVTAPGQYTYWSGYTNKYEIIYYRGMVVVENKSSFVGKVEVKVGGQSAIHQVASGVADPSDNSACPGTLNKISGCSSTLATGDSTKFYIAFDPCYTPIITSFDKNEGTTADKISINDYGFSSTDCNNEIAFGDAICTVTSSSDSLLECSIDPTNSPTIGLMQDISGRVNNLGNAVIEITGRAAKTFVLKPLITGIGLLTASLNGGALLTITGTGFQGDSVGVTVDSYECPINSVSYTEIVCVTPPNFDGIKKIEVTVRAGGVYIPAVNGTSCQIIYDDADAPEIFTISPLSVDGMPTAITINGTGFSDEVTNTKVKIGGQVCNVTDVIDNEITCDITHVAAGTQNVEVIITNKGRATNTGKVQINSLPVISNVSPSKGSINGGTELVISGNGFVDQATSVLVGGIVCDLEEVTLSSLKCKTRNHAAENVSIVIVSNGQNYDAEPFDFSEDVSPTIISISPSTGTKDTLIVISGSNFGTSQEDVTVLTGSEPCTVTFVNDTEVRCMTGAVAISTTPVVINVKGSGLSNNDVTFEFGFSVDGIAKSSGSLAGGQIVTITGSGFDDSTTVTICGVPCVKDETAVQNPSQFVCVTPATEDNVDRQCDVITSVDDVSKTLLSGYTYTLGLTPFITGVNPPRGGTGGGVSLTVTGVGFGNETDKASVTIGGTVCEISTVTDTEIICITGQHSPSQKTSVRVEIDGNGMARQTSADFYYIDVWSSPFTWGGGNPPEDGTLVVIPKGNIILLDQNTNRLKMVLIKGGELIFDEVDVELFADNILIVEGGRLQIGTEAEPFQHKAYITVTAHLRTKELPIYGTNSLGVREGVLDLHGKPVTVVWTRLAETAEAGDRVIILQQEVDWEVGNEIVIASTGHRHSQRENEKHTISAIDVDKKTITLVDPLKFKHLGVNETVNGHFLEYRAEVGLLTRNIVLRGERDRQWTEIIAACPNGFDTGEFAVQTCFQGRYGEEIGSDQFGIQVMIHPPRPNENLAIGRVSYVEFTYAGQAFRLGRYPFHFHLGGNMATSYIKGCALHETFNRAVNIHGSHNTLVENNVAYNVMGGALFLEDGIETGNTLQYNLIVFVRESSSLLNDDQTPASVWATNPKNYIQHNAAAGGTHFGYWYRMHQHPEGPSRTNTVCPRNQLLGAFNNNTAHSFGWYGLWIFETYHPRVGGTCGSGTPTPAVFRNFFAWNCNKGSETVNSGLLQFVNFTLVNNRLVGHDHLSSLEGPWYTDNSPMLKDGLIIGRSLALSSSAQGCTSSGVKMPRSYRFVLDGTEFANFNEGGCVAISINSGPQWNGGLVYHTKNLKFFNVGSKNRGSFKWEFEGIIYDLDGTLTGTAEQTLVPSGNILPPECTYFEGFSAGVSASACSPGFRILRFSLNGIKPDYFAGNTMNIENSNGKTVGHWQTKRVTHYKGWMVTLPVNDTYYIDFGDRVTVATNMSFSGTFGLFNNDDYIILSIEVGKKPDRVFLGNYPYRNSTELELNVTENYHGDWFYNETTKRISVLVSGRNRPSMGRKKRAASDTSPRIIGINFSSYKCYWEHCITPPDLNTIPPPSERTAHYEKVRWSDLSTWYNETQPVDCDNVTVDAAYWRIVDMEIPSLGDLTIYGVLYFDHGNPEDGYRDFVLNVTNIVILGGRLIIGYEESPFLGNINIILQTQCFEHEVMIPVEGVYIGTKVIGAYGGLDLHGKKVETPWTTLNVTVQEGEKTLTLNDYVDWEVGNEIVIAPTGYSAWETETFSITEIVILDNNQTVLTLNDTVNYRHLAYNDGVVTMTAEVGLLTRNIRIEGEDYPDLMEDMVGGRILVGECGWGRGFARISNVEFYRMGQQGYTNNYDPRYAVAYMDSGPVTSLRPSFVKNNAFHHGFSPAIGVYNAPNMLVENNVVHHSIKFAIETNSDNTQIKRNMVTLIVWDGTYPSVKNVVVHKYEAAISALDATSLVLEGNRVSGSERLAYQVPPLPCDTPKAEWYNDNIARTSLMGVGTFNDYKGKASCNRISGFMVLKCWDHGVYYQNEKSVIFEDLVLADNQVGIFPFIVGPPSKSHLFEDKTITVKNVQVIGTTSTFDCSTDRKKMSEVNVKSSGMASSHDPSRKIGITFGTFTSEKNKATRGLFTDCRSYQTIKGLTILQDVTFSRFSSDCSDDKAIATNRRSDDSAFPIKSRGLIFKDVPNSNKILIHRPNLGKINPADCIDMDCDGFKKAFLKDLDGSFLGTPGSVIPQSEWQWNGDPRRGLGDYRIPKTMLTELTGKRIDVNTIAPIKGIIRDKNCTFNADWNAYECHKFDYEMLVIESLDSDTESRRLSPVAILGHDEAGDGVLDLINGPQDHGWCSGYACRKRLSTFQAIVATGKDYLIHFTSTTPQRLRYFLLNSVNTQAIGLQVWYSQPFRLDVFYNGAHVMPVNGRWKAGAYILNPPPVGQPDAYKPNVRTDPAGTNWFDRRSGILHFIVKGPAEIEVKTIMQIIIDFRYPATTVDEFFGEKIVEYLAAFFDLPPEKVRVVDIVSASGRRRKRSTEMDQVIVEISDEPSSANETLSSTLTLDKIQELYDQAVLEGQIGNYSVVLNGTVLEVRIFGEYVDPSDERWASVSTSDGYRALVPVAGLNFHTKLVPMHEGVKFATQPQINVFDIVGIRIDQLGTNRSMWYVNAEIRNGTGNPAAKLKGTTSVPFVNGWANFTDLAIDLMGTGYIIDFNVTQPSQADWLTLASDPFDVAAKPIIPVIVSFPANVYEGENMPVTIELKDDVTGEKINDIKWRGHTWNAVIEIGKPELYNGTLVGTKGVRFSTHNEQANFYTLKLTKMGMTVIKYHITSSPAEYDLYIEELIIVKGRQHDSLVVEEESRIELKINRDYNTIVGSEEKYLGAMFGDWFTNQFTDVRFGFSSLRHGSIMVTLSVSGSHTDVNSTLYSACSLIENGLSFNFNGDTLTLEPYMLYNAHQFYGVICGVKEEEESTESDASPSPTTIIAGVAVALSVLCVIIVLVMWKYMTKKKNNKLGLTPMGSEVELINYDDLMFYETAFFEKKALPPNSHNKVAPAHKRINRLAWK